MLNKSNKEVQLKIVFLKNKNNTWIFYFNVSVLETINDSWYIIIFITIIIWYSWYIN